MSQTVNNLNTFLSDLHVLNAKLYHFHWYVKGDKFFTLHEKFEELYEEVHALIDEVAERNLMIGGKPLSTLSEYVKNATLEEESRELSSVEMIRVLLADYKQLVELAKGYSDDAADEHDKATEDLFIGVIASFEKTVWMLSAYLDE